MLEERLQWNGINTPELMVFLVVSFPLKKYWPLLYAWAYKFMASQAVQKSSLDSEAMSTEMMADWYNYCQKNYESSCGAYRGTWYNSRSTSPSLASITVVAQWKESGFLVVFAEKQWPPSLFQ